MLSFLELSAAYQLSLTQWLLISLAMFILGISKSGIKGITIIIVTLMALVLGAKPSTGIMLPMLIVGDILAIFYYKKHVQWKYLVQLLPWMMIGVVLGTFAGKDLPEAIFKQGMAVIILFSVGMMYWWDKKSDKSVPTQWWFGGSMGLAAGFTTMIGNLAGAFSNIFFLAMRLPKNHFIGTAAWLFFFINIFKLPFHIFVWETITPETIALNIRLVPPIIIGFFSGTMLVKKIKEQHYRQMILILTALGALLILLR